MPKSRFVTLGDNMEHTQRYMHTLRQGILKKKFTLEELGEMLPCPLNVNSWKGTIYMNQKGEKILKLSAEKIQEMRGEFWKYCFEPEKFIANVNNTLNLLPLIKKGKTYTYWDEVRPYGGKHYDYYYSTCIILPHPEETLFAVMSIKAKEMGFTNQKVARLLKEDELVEKYFKQFQLLTEREKQIIHLLVQGYSNPQISEQLYIARSTVETHRKNINRKLGFSSYFQLVRFAQAFDLV